MLITSERLRDQPIMSLQTGIELGTTARPVIDPAKLQIIAYEATVPLRPHQLNLLRIDDIREISDIGFIIDDIDEIVTAGDVIKLDEIYQLGFELDGIKVLDEKRKKIGHVTSYTIDVDDFAIEQLVVKRTLLHRLNDTELVVHRSQLLEISRAAIVIKRHADTPEHTRATSPGSYVNPFRRPRSVAEQRSR